MTDSHLRPANDNSIRHRLVTGGLRQRLTGWRDTPDEVVQDALAGGYAEQWTDGIVWDPMVTIETEEGGRLTYWLPDTNQGGAVP